MDNLKFGVVVFPGSNCDHDAYHVLKHEFGQDTVFLWHKNASLEGADVVVLPGGFAHGDYLRCGAIARFSPIMREVVAFAQRGGVVLGICNGFQVLCEAGLLPGALVRNECLTFVCRDVYLRVENSHSRFTAECGKGEVLRIPVAHGEGNYIAGPDVLQTLEEHDRILFRYCDLEGNVTRDANPNGSTGSIAGILNAEGNVMGMMPHPERASESILGNTDGRKIFSSLISSFVLHEDPLPSRRIEC